VRFGVATISVAIASFAGPTSAASIPPLADRIVVPSRADLGVDRIEFEFTLDRFARPTRVASDSIASGAARALDSAIGEWIVLPATDDATCLPRASAGRAALEAQPDGTMALVDLTVDGHRLHATVKHRYSLDELSNRRDSRIVVAPTLVTPAPDRVAMTSRRPPIYPRAAVVAEIEGRTTVRFTISHAGEISAIEIAEERLDKPGEPAGLGSSLLNAVKKWRFGALTRGGLPSEFQGCAAATFRMVRRSRDD
jgi:TonB family protein